MARRWSPGRAIISALLVASVGCEEPQTTRVSPPRCEPDGELTLERQLKRGYRALVQQETRAAREAFQRVLTMAPGHPEAGAALRSMDGGDATRPTPWSTGRGVQAGDEVLPVHAPVDSSRYRFEELDRQRAIADQEGLKGVGSLPPIGVLSRRGAGASQDTEHVLGRVDLLVIRPSHTRTPREHFLQLASAGAATHFSVDRDGTIVQHLDVLNGAQRVARRDLVSRAVFVDMINPVFAETAGGDAETPSITDPRPRHEVIDGQGANHVVLGYTAAQVRSLSRLLDVLVSRLPSLDPRLPRDDAGAVMAGLMADQGATFRGIARHSHLVSVPAEARVPLDWRQVMARVARPTTAPDP